MTTNKKFLMMMFWVFSFQWCNAQESQQDLVVSLQEAISIAKDENRSLKENAIDVSIAKTQIDQAKAQGLPQVSGTFNYQATLLNSFAKRTSGSGQAPYSGNVYAPFSAAQSQTLEAFTGNYLNSAFSALGEAFASKHSSTASVAVNQQLFNGVYLIGLKAAQVYAEMQAVQAEPTKRDIEKNVEKAYYGALITKENMDMLDKNINNIQTFYDETKEIYEAGFAEQLDLDRLALSLSTLQTQKNALKEIQILNYNVLKNVMSLPLSTNLELTEEMAKFEQDAKEYDALAELANPNQWAEFQVFDVQEKIQKLDIQRYEYGKYPTVYLFTNGNYGYQGNKFIFNKGWYPNLVAGLNINVPIFDGNLRRNQIKQKKLELEKIGIARETLQMNIDIAIQNAVTQFTNAKKELETQENNIELAEKIYDTTKIKYKAGVGSSIEVNQAEQSLFSAQQGKLNALYNLLIAKVDLDKALGK